MSDEHDDYPDYDDVDADAEADAIHRLRMTTPPGDNNVLVFRNGAQEPVAVPAEVVTEAERAYRCYTAHLGGRSWEQIAMDERYPSALAAKSDVDRYMSEGKALVLESSQRDMLVLEVARLNALQMSVWPMATSGHIPSVAAAINIIKLRSQLVGLDPDKMADQADQARTVVYVGKESEDYIAGLKKAAAEDTPPQHEPPA